MSNRCCGVIIQVHSSSSSLLLINTSTPHLTFSLPPPPSSAHPLTRSLEARKSPGSPEALRKRRLALRYRSGAASSLRTGRHTPAELQSDAYLAACALMLSADVLGASPNWREIARLARMAVHARGGCEAMLRRAAEGMQGPSGGQGDMAMLCALSQVLVLDLYGEFGVGGSGGRG